MITGANPNLVCTACHAEISPAADATKCPACGGRLIASPSTNLDPPDAPPKQADHRGILLPRRHAVGGVITPR